jgi:hypothetical protein
MGTKQHGLHVQAQIRGINYTYFLCSPLQEYPLNKLSQALETHGAFILNIGGDNRIAVSWWVSAKRTRSYPYARVYNTLNFVGRKVTIIPIMKDEGKQGDRDFLQWDTISLMSLLDVYVIIAYYNTAQKSRRYTHKITDQRFDRAYIKQELARISSFQSSALHWNIDQIDKVKDISNRAVQAYTNIPQQLGVSMHSLPSVQRKVHALYRNKETFMESSRHLAEIAQHRESVTLQPKESLSGSKGMITIRNYLGGWYYFTVDEIEIRNDTVFLIEGKHTRKHALPSLSDIQDGLVKMVLFSNLEQVTIDGTPIASRAVLKLTSTPPININTLTQKNKDLYSQLLEEAATNRFDLRLV